MATITVPAVGKKHPRVGAAFLAVAIVIAGCGVAGVIAGDLAFILAFGLVIVAANNFMGTNGWSVRTSGVTSMANGPCGGIRGWLYWR